MTKIKKFFYIFTFTVAGIFLQFLVHVVVEKWYIKLLLQDFGLFGFGLSWGQWFAIHNIGTAVLFFGGTALGLWLGIFFWPRLYDEQGNVRPRKWKKDKLIQKVKALHLPKGKYAVFGSGPIVVRGIRKGNDIDIIVTKDIYNNFKKRGWKPIRQPSGSVSLERDEVEIFQDWKFENYNPDIERLISASEEIDGIPFVDLDEVIKWKKCLGRKKDLEDIRLINIHLGLEKK